MYTSDSVYVKMVLELNENMVLVMNLKMVLELNENMVLVMNVKTVLEIN